MARIVIDDAEMDTSRTDQQRCEALATLLYPLSSLHLWTPQGTGLYYVLGYLHLSSSATTLGSGATPEAAWHDAYRVLRARAVALGDDLARELGAP